MDYVREGFDLFLSERFSPYRNVAEVIGTLILLHFSLRLLSSLFAWTRLYFLAPWGIGRTNLKKYGPWAIVTGSSEGIGRGYALELARQGLNVVLMSRSQEKLEKVANEIKEKYGREVRVLPTDFSRGEEIYPEIAVKLKDLDIGILVNNVGVADELPPVQFLDSSIEMIRKMVALNTQTMVHMCHLFMPKMVEKKRGIVINLSSITAIRPSSLLTVYGSTKAFIEFFTKGLSLEYAGKEIIIQIMTITVAPFFVATAMTSVLQPNLLVAESVQYGRSAVATIGIRSYTQGCLSHALQAVLLRCLPLAVKSWSEKKIMKVYEPFFKKL